MTKLVLLSDTHTFHDEVIVPECDILLCAGDFSSTGKAGEVKKFLDWYSVQPATHKIYIAGNHDLSYEDSPEFKARMVHLYPNITYLEVSGINVCGLNIWGDPHQPWFCDWAFNLPRGIRLKEQWDKIPDDTDILVTHGPPHGILDTISFTGEHAGCLDMLDRITKMNLKLVVFGHIHENYGQVKSGNTIYANVGLCDDRYDIVNQPMVIEL